MKPRKHQLKDGRLLVIREAAAQDARAVLDYIEAISGESDFLSFGPGEFEITEAEEENLLGKYRDADNQLYLLGLVDDMVVSTLSFAAGRRPRIRHSGEFSMSVRKQVWGLGIGSWMLDTLMDWARATQIVKKINLRVRTDNHRAIQLYERKGFVKEGTIHKEICLDGEYFDHHWMGLELGQAFDKPDFRRQLEGELTGNILPFWMTYVVDRVNGGFYGAVTNELQVHNEVPRSATLCARILWTYARAYRRSGAEQHLSMARWAYDYLTRVFWDQEFGGLYWEVDYRGNPVSDRKHHYAQAFAIYGLAEYYRATQEPQSLVLAQRLFHLLEKHAYDPVYGGYIEGSSREWEALLDMRLSDRDLNCPKSMNTMLHILEAYTHLLRVWEDAHLRAQHRALLETFEQHIMDHQTGHLKLFFDDQWRSLSDHISYGHDIEGSWLLVEAAEVQGDPDLMAQVRQSAINMAESVYREGTDDDGSLFYEADPQGLVDTSKSWWVQAEAMVGFYNAYQLTGQAHFARAAHRCWSYIQAKMIDRTHGDWYKQLHRDGTVNGSIYKAGPWECPYHHSRACFEMLARLDS